MSTESHIIVCPQCRALNRVQSGRESQATCGKCKAKVFDAHPLELVGPTFDRHLAKTTVPLLVDFYSPTCGPCLMMGPEFEKAAQTLYPDVRLAKLDTSAENAVAGRFHIQAVPTLVLFRDGREIARQSGATGAGDLVTWVRQNL